MVKFSSAFKPKTDISEAYFYIKQKKAPHQSEGTEKLQFFSAYHRFNAMFAKKNVLFVKFFIVNSIATGKVIDFFSGVPIGKELS